MGQVLAVTTGDILTVFEQMGLRNTRPRRLIADKLAALASSGRDFSTDDLWMELKVADPDLGRSTVFRAVDLLTEQRVLDRVTFADGTHRYRVCGVGAHHHHITCVQCHRVVEVEACIGSDMLHAIENSTDFSLEGHSLELFGRCRDCRGR
jgi:Fur family transcriptional regulator, ferric uptake regulator